MADTDKNQDEQENADTSLIESLKSLKRVRRYHLRNLI